MWSCRGSSARETSILLQYDYCSSERFFSSLVYAPKTFSRGSKQNEINQEKKSCSAHAKQRTASRKTEPF